MNQLGFFGRLFLPVFSLLVVSKIGRDASEFPRDFQGDNLDSKQEASRENRVGFGDTLFDKQVGSFSFSLRIDS